MPIFIDGKEILHVNLVGANAAPIAVMKMNTGQLVFHKVYEGPPSPIEIDDTILLVAGIDFPASQNVTLCMIGGGGSGAVVIDNYWYSGGGHAGDIINTIINVAYGTTVNAHIGNGGAARSGFGSGNPGTDTYFGDIVTAGGGSGGNTGTVVPVAFGGDGQTIENCQGSFRHGSSEPLRPDSHSYGGQAGFADGGRGAGGSVVHLPADPGSLGSGGGGSGTVVGPSGAGGKGRIVLSW